MRDDAIEHDHSDARDRLTIQDLAFVGFHSRVVALDRDTGEIVWDWKSPKGSSSHVAVLLDGDRLIVSVSGYMYCLDPITGSQRWYNPLKGFGTGIPSLTSIPAVANRTRMTTLLPAPSRRWP